MWFDGRRGVVVVVLVAADAGSISDVVVVIDVAVGAGAGRHGVRAGEREAGFRVVKGRGIPGGRAVADVAGLGEALLRVIRIVRVLVILQWHDTHAVCVRL